jgi:hypothetical protein
MHSPDDPGAYRGLSLSSGLRAVSVRWAKIDAFDGWAGRVETSCSLAGRTVDTWLCRDFLRRGRGEKMTPSAYPYPTGRTCPTVICQPALEQLSSEGILIRSHMQSRGHHPSAATARPNGPAGEKHPCAMPRKPRSDLGLFLLSLSQGQYQAVGALWDRLGKRVHAENRSCNGVLVLSLIDTQALT